MPSRKLSSLFSWRASRQKKTLKIISLFIGEPPPLLLLPRELRDQIFFYLLPAPTGPNAAPFQPATSTGITLLSSPPPPLYLLLICRQLTDEVLDRFYATTTFRISSLSPHSSEWCPDPKYLKLHFSPHLPKIRHLDIRVSLECMGMSQWRNELHYTEMYLSLCILKVRNRAELLADTLWKRGDSLRTVTVSWWDDYGNIKMEEDSMMKWGVLEPFKVLEGVNWRAGDVWASGKVREGVVNGLEAQLNKLNHVGEKTSVKGVYKAMGKDKSFGL
ncbi:hypothetical protein K432DRAFT_378444 [Lepidopterella palustris CBS 459.81]|uniref:F-box domain-containing protein n=1 Tax=Lepidopterella palustris CBS 459.81 TaxID=1314670 RepID=A0A8E2EIW2_9PEZI|nr:hypothetical protein K432DRAFT_378444 [Lepidopterella palustris CBS 459.81]